MTTLLEKAKRVSGRKRDEVGITQEDVPLCLAYLQKKISIRQVLKAKGISSNGGFYPYMVRVLRFALGNESIKITEGKQHDKT